MVKIQIASDLHLEFKENHTWLEQNPLIPKGDILLLAGDIILDKYKKRARNFYEKISADFPQIISTMGNHEFYRGTLSYAYPSYSGKISSNHLRLNNGSIILGKTKIIASILWTDILPQEEATIEKDMNDYQFIKETDVYGEKIPLTITRIRQLHRISLDFLLKEIEKPFAGKIVVMTHHLPSYACLSQIYTESNINSAYATELDEFIRSHPQIALWVCGHSHGFCDITIGKTRIVKNTLGYVQEGQQFEFRRDFVVEV